MYVDDFFAIHIYLKSRHYSTSENKGYSQTTPFHLTRLFELRKSCWELCDSQRVWKSQIIECFSGKIGRFFSETHFCDEKMENLRDFVRYSPNSFPRNFFFFPRNFFFFPRDFENVRENQGKIGEKLGKLRENRRKLPCFKIREWKRRIVSTHITVGFS